MIFDRNQGLLMLYENCLTRETEIPDPVRKHLSENTVPYLLLIFLVHADEIKQYIPLTIPGHLRRNNVFEHHINAFTTLFARNLHDHMYSDGFNFNSVFITIQNFYNTLYELCTTKNELICLNLAKRLGYIPSYLSPIQRKRLLIYTHLDQGTLRECNNYLKKNYHPMIILHETSPQNQYLRPDEWRILSAYLPVHLSLKGQICIDNFRKLLYPQTGTDNVFEYQQIPPGGGCGWEIPGVDTCLIQFLTFLQPNWMELWTDLRWNICIEMLKRLTWLNENVHLLIIDPTDILSILFSPD